MAWFYVTAMSASTTPILDLEIAPPRRSGEVSLQGLIKAIPAALAVCMIVPLGVLIRVFAEKYLPSWTNLIFRSSLPLSRIFNPLSRMELLPGLLTIWIGMWVATALHESGHALAAWSGGWRLLEIRAVPFTFQNRDGKWRLKVCWKLWPAAAVFAEPKTIRFHSRLRAYAVAGPAANLLTFILIITILVFYDGSQAPAVLGVICGWSLFGAIFNLLPIHVRHMELDGYIAAVLSRRPNLLAARIASTKIRNHLLAGKPLVEVNQRWIALAEGVGSATLQNFAGLWLAYSYWFEKDEYDRAARIFEKVLHASGNLNDEAKGIVYSECAIIQSFRKRNATAQAWVERANDFPQPEYIHHHRNSCLAFNNDDLDQAEAEAELAKLAAIKLQDKAVREAFLKSWSRWIDEIQRKRAAPAKFNSEGRCQAATL
jgi:hypothetical protein